MDKKFLTAEEAIAQFGIASEEFQRLVDEGELRSLADRGNWKFRRDEIEQLISEGLLVAKFPAGDGDASASQTLEIESGEEAGPTDFAFLDQEDQAPPEGATMIKPTADFDFEKEESTGDHVLHDAADEVPTGFASDSEIMMVDDSEIQAASSAPTPPAIDVPVAESLSEFDMATVSGGAKSASDSGLNTSESSVIIGGDEEKPESDSDVKVVSGGPVDSGILLADDSAVNVATEDHVISPAGPISGISTSDSDVKIADSGISLERDSGITMDSDSGLTLESSVVSAKPDSGLTLDADSGIQLEPGDSGIALEGADSGLSLEDDSGIKVSGAKKPSGRAPRPDDTQAEFDELGSDEFMSPGDTDHTAMIAIEESGSELETLPPAKGMKAKSRGLSGTFEAAEEVEDLEIVDDLDAGELDVDEVDEDDELDVLEASDEAFTMEESGESSEASIASLPSVKGVAYKEPSWGVAAVIPIALCAALCLVQALILWDGVHTMWTGDTAKALSAPIISALGG